MHIHLMEFSSPIMDEYWLSRRLQDNMFAGYANQNFDYHISRCAEIPTSIMDQLEKLLQENSTYLFNKEISRKTVDPYVVWTQLESFSMSSPSDYVDIWFGESSSSTFFHHLVINQQSPWSDECHGFAETIVFVGRALLTSLQLFKNCGLLKPYEPTNGGFRNLSIVIALFVKFAKSWISVGVDH
jgi:hypothetical protein